MFNKFINWLKSTPKETPPTAEISSSQRLESYCEEHSSPIAEKSSEETVTISEETAGAVIEELLQEIDFIHQSHFEHINNLETLVKSLVLSQGGTLSLAKDFVAIITNNNYLVRIVETENSLEVTLDEFDPEQDQDEEGDEE